MSVKISELPILDSLADNDVIAGVDTSANVTSKIEMATLKSYIDTNTQYTAGTNINITNNVISAPFVYDKTQTNALLDDFKDETNASIEDLKDEKDAQIEELQSEVDSLSTIFNAFPTESGEGESVTLDDTAEVKFKKFDLKGNTSQTGTPTPSSPIPVNVVSGDNEIRVQGKNLAYMKNGTYSYSSNIGVITDNNKFTLNTSETWGAYGYFSFANGYSQQWAPESNISGINDMNITPNGGNYIFTINTSAVMSKSLSFYAWTSTGRNFNTRIDGTTTKTLSISLNENEHIKDYGIWTDKDNIFSNWELTLQLEKGSSATTYELYQGKTYNIDLPVENLYEGSQDFSGTWTNTSQWATDENTYNGLVVKKRMGQWQGLSKDIQVENGETYTFSLYAKSDTARDIGIYIGGGTASVRPYGTEFSTTTEWKRYSVTFTCNSSGTVKPRLENRTTGETSYTYICGYQLEKGSKQNNFTPYGTIPIELCKIGNYQDYFGKSDGRNLFDKDKDIVEDYTFGNDDISISATDFFYQAYYIPVEPNTTYSFLGQKTLGSDSLRVCEYTSDKTFIKRNYELYTITTTQNTHYIRVSNYKGKLNTTQVEKGSSVTLWQPYGVGKWYKYGAIGYVMFDGSEDEDWIERSSTSANYWKVRYDGGLPTFITARLDMITNYFVPNGGANDAGYSGNAICGNAGQYANWVHISIDNTIANSVASFRTWLSTHNLKVYYVQATPTTTEITYQPLIDQLNLLEKAMSKDGQTNISQVNNDLGFVIYAEAIKSLENVLDRLALVEE